MMKDEREIRVTRYELRVAYCVVSFKFQVSGVRLRGTWYVTLVYSDGLRMPCRKISTYCSEILDGMSLLMMELEIIMPVT